MKISNPSPTLYPLGFSLAAHKPPLSLGEWKARMQVFVQQLASSDPKAAEQLLLHVRCFSNTKDQRAQLRALGLELPAFFRLEGLPGGMDIGAGAVIDNTASAIKGAAKFFTYGNKKLAKEKARQGSLKMSFQVPGSLEWAEGDHKIEDPTIGRVVSKKKRSFKKAYSPYYTVEASGPGVFESLKMSYKGYFLGHLLHDRSENACCTFIGKLEGARIYEKEWLRYTGDFEEGKLEGRGVLERQDPKTRQYYKYYEGTWGNNCPENGCFYSPQKEVIERVEFEPTATATEDGDFPFLLPRPPVPSVPPTAEPSSVPIADLPFDTSPFPPAIHPLIARALAKEVLSPFESLSLMIGFMEAGALKAKELEGKECLYILGELGSGKSTFVNYLAGCTLVEELVDGERFIRVLPVAEGGTLDSLTEIGHSDRSTTFLPAMVADKTGRFYCDCAGFFDNRGPEFNIANAVNTRHSLRAAGKVRALLLINYFSLKTQRGRGVKDSLDSFRQLFGSTEAVEANCSSLLVGISHCPLGVTLEEVRGLFGKNQDPLVPLLLERLFIFDPLDRSEGFWNRQQCLEALEGLKAIEEPKFNTVLLASDEKKLLSLSEQIGNEIKQALKERDYSLAASKLAHFESLAMIEHNSVERMLNESFFHVGHHFEAVLNDFKDRCYFGNFTAEGLLEELQRAMSFFGGRLEEVVDTCRLESIYTETLERFKEREEREQQALEEARGKVEALLKLLDDQKLETEKQLESLEVRHQEKQTVIEQKIQEIQKAYSQMEEELGKERQAKLLKEDEIRAKQRLEEEYLERLHKYEQDKVALLEEQLKSQQDFEKTLEEEKLKLQERLEAIEVQRLEKLRELKAMNIPSLAFGPEDWERYFGAIGEVPPLPANIYEILNSPCPYFSYWPFNRKKVKDTHLLVLMPATINGAPLTLNSLGELIQNPQGGGHRTEYRNYWSKLKEQKGEEGISEPYWLLITKDVIPYSRNKTFGDQQKLIKEGYSIPKALEVATALLVHHVRSGERLCPDNPWTYTRCEEKIDANRVCVGGFAPSGLHLLLDSIYYDDDFSVNNGLLLSRKLLGP